MNQPSDTYAKVGQPLFEIDAMVVVRAKRRIALRTLALARLVASFEALETEDVETFGQNSIFLLHLARRTRQLLLVLAYFFHQNFVGRTRHLDLLCAVQLLAQNCQLFLNAKHTIGHTVHINITDAS